jgi:ADP-heptose:LPS heptosyltransferase
MVRTVVIVELTRLGDVITVLPVISEFRRKFPAARLRVVVDASYASLLAVCGPEVEVSAIRGSLTAPGFLRALRSVRAMKADLICSMSPSNRNSALALASGAQFIIGYLNGTDSLTPFLGFTPVESIGFRIGPDILFGGENIEGRSWKVLETLGKTKRVPALREFVSWRPEVRLQNDIHVDGIPLKAPFIVMHPFSGWEFRTWPIERFRELTRRLLDRLDFDIVFICHLSEREQLSPLEEAFRAESRVHFYPSEDVLLTAALLRGAALFVGNDSGPLHLAALLGIPIVGLYGPAAPSFTAPLSARGTFLYHPVGCSPCSQTTCVQPGDHCMKKIEVNEAFEAIALELKAARFNRTPMHG